VVETGPCTSDSSYKLSLNFQVANPPSNTFSLFANGAFFGNFNLSQLPLTLNNFPWNGGNFDVVKVCFGNAGIVTCCATKEFAVPDCLTGGGPCIITGLTAIPGDCTGNTTYHLKVNFQVTNPPSTNFQLFANGVLFGTYALAQLPLAISNFPWDGGNADFITVCMVSTGTPALCCAAKEFPVPGCLGGMNCAIFDLHVTRTPCLCGQFFALVSFEYSNPVGNGFDIVLNGNMQGSFPYTTPQPVILGPLNGDNVTNYKFLVRDHELNSCADDFQLGKVDCPVSPTFAPTDGSKLVISPNPANEWLHVQVQLPGGAAAGYSQLAVFHADGRKVIEQAIQEGSVFTLDISVLPAGLYRLVVQTDFGIVESTFAKQF
jgi:hypothetical protein